MNDKNESNSGLRKIVDSSFISSENKCEWKMKDQKRLVVRHRDPGTKLHDIVTRDYHVLHLDYVA